MSLTISKNILHPAIRIEASGWQTTIGSLNQHGWKIEMQYYPDRLSHVFYLRNPSKFMTGMCHITDEYVQVLAGGQYPIAYMDERVLLRAEFYERIHIPQVELHSVDVGEPMSPYMVSNNAEDWMIYTADNNQTEIIVSPDKVSMLLEQIREAQDPRAKEIIHSQHRRESFGIQTEAKILAFG